MSAPRPSILLIIACLVVFAVVGHCAEPPSFRCFRPFKSLDGFSPKFMHRRDNCAFDFMHIVNASATVRCSASYEPGHAALAGAGTAGSGGAPQKEENGCVVEISFNATVAETRQALGADSARYTLKLGKGGKQIHYKGFDGRGFSTCCTMADGADCEWITVNDTKKQRVNTCPLTGPVGTEFAGHVSRPLHTYVPGKWSAFVNFYRDVVDDDTLVGRLVVPFEVPEVDVAAASEANAVVSVAQPDEV